MTSGWLLAEFPSADALLAATVAVRERGYRAVEAYSPFPVSGIKEQLGLHRSRLPRFVFGGGLIGGILGYGIQWYANVRAYPMNVGGRPMHAAPAFVPATFEATVLGAALVAFIGLLIALRLPAWWHPVFEIDGFEGASADRFWLAIDRSDPLYDDERTGQMLQALDPLRVVALSELPP